MRRLAELLSVFQQEHGEDRLFSSAGYRHTRTDR